MKIIIHKSLYHNDKMTDPKPGVVMHLITQLQLTGTMTDREKQTNPQIQLNILIPFSQYLMDQLD